MNKQEIRYRIEDLLESTERPGVKDLIEHLNKIDFFTAPCSSQYHLCYEGGLAEHSLNVYKQMSKFNDVAIRETVAYDSLIIVSLLHDVGKATYHNKPLYIPNILKDNTQSTKKPYEKNSATLGIPHEVAALEIISRFIELTEEEAHAILFHNGLYTAVGREVNGKETPLQMLLHFADMWASRVIEE